jgi:hypothetical protein
MAKACEQPPHRGQHTLLYDLPRGVRDAEEDVRDLERGEGEAVILREELARFAGDEFLWVRFESGVFPS